MGLLLLAMMSFEELLSGLPIDLFLSGLLVEIISPLLGLFLPLLGLFLPLLGLFIPLLGLFLPLLGLFLPLLGLMPSKFGPSST